MSVTAAPPLSATPAELELWRREQLVAGAAVVDVNDALVVYLAARMLFHERPDLRLTLLAAFEEVVIAAGRDLGMSGGLSLLARTTGLEPGSVPALLNRVLAMHAKA